jgi:hypothetical protein
VFAFGATVPGAHLTGLALPAGHAFPAGQSLHPDTFMSPWSPLYVPAGQGELWALVDFTSQ